ncbi:MAG: acyl-CoA thioesterase [Lachnospiraceae bacterium]|nr:acyl-CoA thioesterase [Lachnospiraceae bacterium]
MQPYRHTVQYYETDKMGVVHHSNYIRWMEEARVDFLRQIGWELSRLEALGVGSPVTALECRFRRPAVFAEDIFITVCVRQFGGVRIQLGYTMLNSAGETVCEAQSEHCFLHTDGSLVRLQRELPEFSSVLKELAEAARP